MSPAQAAYARGVSDVLALARRIADAIEADSARPLHTGFAVEALRALADEATALLLPTAPTVDTDARVSLREKVRQSA